MRLECSLRLRNLGPDLCWRYDAKEVVLGILSQLNLTHRVVVRKKEMGTLHPKLLDGHGERMYVRN